MRVSGFWGDVNGDAEQEREPVQREKRELQLVSELTKNGNETKKKHFILNLLIVAYIYIFAVVFYFSLVIRMCIFFLLSIKSQFVCIENA